MIRSGQPLVRVADEHEWSCLIMKLNEITDNDGLTKKPQRVGRGIGSGTGKPAAGRQRAEIPWRRCHQRFLKGGRMPNLPRLPACFKTFSQRFNMVSFGCRIRFAIDCAASWTARVPLMLAALKGCWRDSSYQDAFAFSSDGDLKTKYSSEARRRFPPLRIDEGRRPARSIKLLAACTGSC